MARDFESERAALLKRADAFWRPYLPTEQRARLDAKERAQLDAAREALARLLDEEIAPQQTDFRAVVAVAPALNLALLAWIDRRLGPVRYATWLNALHPAPQPIPPQTPTAPAIGATGAPTVAKATPTEAEKLERDRRRYEATGEVTTRLLCDIHGIERGALGKYLRNRHNLKDANGARFISTSEPQKFTPKDRGKVKAGLNAGDVKRRPKRPAK